MAAALAAAVGHSLAAQRLGQPEERPKLRDVTDSNDAQAYYDLGLQQFERNPQTAAAAFYWAARINPAWGDPVYGRRAALLMKDSRLLNQAFERTRRASPELRRLDSLQYRALMLSPFLYRRLDQRMLTFYIRENYLRRARTSGGDTPLSTDVDYEINEYLRSASPLLRAWFAYGNGSFDLALKHYDIALGSSRDRASVRLERARIFGMRSQTDSAVAELRLVLDELRKKDEKDLVVFYDSKALAEYSIGILLEGAGDTGGAREAYGKALQEDLAYYPAHLRLGLLALGLKDTATALSELALASDIAGEEPHVRYVHGFVLTAAHHYPDASAELKKAVELEPYYALPYLLLGQVYEQLEKGPEALAAYQGFLDHASLKDMQRDFAVGRVADLKELIQFAPKP
jgi:hypothetical protein